MSVRYAVLWDLDELVDTPDGKSAVPCGFLIDRGDHVQLRMCGGEGNWGLKERFDKPFTELQPDSTEKATSPGDPGYFDRVVESLFRTFGITVPR